MIKCLGLFIIIAITVYLGLWFIFIPLILLYASLYTNFFWLLLYVVFIEVYMGRITTLPVLLLIVSVLVVIGSFLRPYLLRSV